jgi:serine phosphatase RsbU (regulator of sigma subunit)
MTNLLLPGLGYLLVVIAASLAGRLWPGLLAAGLGVGALLVRDIRPNRLSISATSEALAVIVFALTAVLVSSLLDRLERARDAAVRVADRLQRLQSVTAALSWTRAQADVIDVVVKQTASELDASRATLSLIDESGENLVLSGWVGLRPDIAKEWRTYPVSGALPASEAVRTGEMVLLSNLADRNRRYPDIAHTPPDYDHAVAIVPLTVEGRALGAISLSFEEPRPFPPEDQAFLAAVGSQCAQALERSRLYEAEREAAQRQAFLAEASRLLASSLDHEETMTRITDLLVPGLADAVAVHQFEGDELHLVSLRNADPELEDVMRALSAREGDVATDPFMLEVARTGEPLVNQEVPDEIWAQLAQDGEHLALLRRLGTRAGIVAALRSRDRTVGLLTATMCGSGRRFSTGDIELITDLARRAAVAIENSLAHRSRVDVARTLQRSLLPPEPVAIPGLEVASRYHPISDGSEVGGDFFDVFRCAAGEPSRWGVVMGDVCGKGVEAAALTAMARYTVRAVAADEPAPSRVLAHLNRAVLEAEVGERFCTIAHLVVTPGPGGAEITLACGGHPQPLLLTAAGEVRPAGRPGSAIGLFPEAEVVDSVLALGPGDALVLYTDGVTEARSPTGAFAPTLLEEALMGRAGATAEDIAAAIERAVLDFGEGTLRDDMAVLVLRVPPD